MAYEKKLTNKPGSKWIDSEANFFVMGAIVKAVTGEATFDLALYKYMGLPLGFSEIHNYVGLPGLDGVKSVCHNDPGCSMVISPSDYALFLGRLCNKSIVTGSLHDLAEQAITGGDIEAPSKAWAVQKEYAQYSLGQFRECDDESCKSPENMIMSWPSEYGSYPWIYRKDRWSDMTYWGLIYQLDVKKGDKAMAAAKEVSTKLHPQMMAWLEAGNGKDRSTGFFVSERGATVRSYGSLALLPTIILLLFANSRA